MNAQHKVRSIIPAAWLSSLPLGFLILFATNCNGQAPPAKDQPDVIRVATYNVSMNRRNEGDLRRDLAGSSEQIKKIATVIRAVRPDILLLNEFDNASDGSSIDLFRQRYLGGHFPDSKTEPIAFPYFFASSVNTGQPSGMDLDQDGKSTGAGDAFGYGAFPGQYAMAVLSAYPIDEKHVRTFQKFLWKNLPDAAAPQTESLAPWYPPEVWENFRLSSKSHWDVPISVNGQTIHLLASHPTPPAFDGPEDRNGRRNHDEIRLWAEYVSGNDQTWLVDDQGKHGGLPLDEAFVVAGDLNADPVDGSGFANAGTLLLKHPRINAGSTPSSKGGIEASKVQGKANNRQSGPPQFDTADFSDRSVGNLRVDYVLPSVDFEIVDSGVMWPASDRDLAEEASASDHRMVWIDIRRIARTGAPQ